MKHIKIFEEFINESVNEAEKIEVGVFVRYKKDKDFTGGKIKSIKGSNAEIHNWDGSTTQLPLKDLEYVKSWNESVNEAIDTEYWATYNTDTTINVNKKFAEKSKNFDKTFKEAVSNWNSEADDEENKLPSGQEPKIKKLANEYFKKEGWISINVIQAMISQKTF
jgi:hypothetical protein